MIALLMLEIKHLLCDIAIRLQDNDNALGHSLKSFHPFSNFLHIPVRKSYFLGFFSSWKHLTLLEKLHTLFYWTGRQDIL